MLPAQPNESLIDGIACLQALAVSSHPIGVRQMARDLKLNPTRVNRLLKTLAHLGMAQQTLDRKYVPGPAMHILSVQSLLASGLIRAAIGPLDALKKFGKIVALGVLWKDHVCYLYHGRPDMTSTESLGRSELYPATRSSIGMVLLSFQPEEITRNVYEQSEIPGFAGGIEELMAALKKVRHEEFAYVMQEPDPLNASLAVPLGNPPYAGIAFARNVHSEEVQKLLPELEECASLIERKLKQK